MSADQGKRRIILHIGTHKTGSTTIQAGLKANRRMLLRYGIDYPQMGVVGQGHHNIAFDLADHRWYIPAFGGFTRLVQHIHRSVVPTTIISAEQFSRLSDQQIARLAEPLAPCVRIVVA